MWRLRRTQRPNVVSSRLFVYLYFRASHQFHSPATAIRFLMSHNRLQNGSFVQCIQPSCVDLPNTIRNTYICMCVSVLNEWKINKLQYWMAHTAHDFCFIGNRGACGRQSPLNGRFVAFEIPIRLRPNRETKRTREIKNWMQSIESDRWLKFWNLCNFKCNGMFD